MNSERSPNVSISFFDRILLGAALILGIVATLRSFGTGEITVHASALLAAGVLLSLRPLIRLIGASNGSGSRRGSILAVIFGAHLVATLFFFPPEDILNSRPVTTLDHALHYQQMVRAREVFGESYRLHAYDPYFMAGYPGGTVFDIDSKGVELWCVTLGFAGTARAYKFFIILGYLLLPFTIYAGSRRLGFSFIESVLSLLVLLAFWHWGRPYVGEFRFAGMFSFLIVCHLSIFLLGLFRSFLREEKAKTFWLAGPLAFLIHPTAAVLLPVSFLALFVVERRQVPPDRPHRKWELKVLTGIVAWSLLVLVVNAIWLIPLFRYLDIKIASDTFFQLEGIRGLLDVLVKPGNLPALLIVVLSITGFVHLIRNGRSGDAAAPAAGSLFMLTIAAFGIHLSVFNQMEPGRFLVPGLMFMALLAGPGLMMLYRYTKKTLSTKAVTAVLIALLVSSPAFGLLASRAWYRHTLRTTLTDEVVELIDALERFTEPSGRLMIEDGPAWNYGDSFIPAMIPQFTGVEQIGGPYPWAFIKHNFTNFFMCSAMGKSLPEMDENRLWQYISLYNIRWILTSTPDCREFFEGFLKQAPIWDSRHFCLWRVDQAGGSLEDRGVTIVSGYDRIAVTLTPDIEGKLPERVLLPYHWDRGLRIRPPAVMSCERRMEDPIPFIVIEPNGESEILIEFR